MNTINQYALNMYIP